MGSFPAQLPSGDPGRRERRNEARETLSAMRSIVSQPVYVHNAHVAVLTRLMTDPSNSRREHRQAAGMLATLQARILPKLADVQCVREIILDELGLPRGEAAPAQSPQIVINIGVPEIARRIEAGSATVVDVEPIPLPPPEEHGGGAAFPEGPAGPGDGGGQSPYTRNGHAPPGAVNGTATPPPVEP